MILLRTDDLESIQPLLDLAPMKILKYIIAQYSKVRTDDRFSHNIKIKYIHITNTNQHHKIHKHKDALATHINPCLV